MQQPKKINPTAPHKLSVLIHQDGLCFYIYTRSGDLVERIERSFKHALNPIELLVEIENTYASEEQLEHDYCDFTLIYHHDIYTMVPDAVYDPTVAADYLKYNTRLLKTDVISIDDPVESIAARCVYIAYSNVNNYFHEMYDSFNYYHYTTLALQQHTISSGNNPYQVLIDVKESFFYLTLLHAGKLILHNVYPQQAPEDILFYTLFATQHNGYDPEVMNVLLAQEKENNKVYELLYTYIRNLIAVTDYPSFIKPIVCV